MLRYTKFHCLAWHKTSLITLLCTACILHILSRIILHLNRMKVAHSYVPIYVCISCFGYEKMKLVHFGYITHNLWNYIDILVNKIVFSRNRHLLAYFWASETCVLASAITHDHLVWPAPRHLQGLAVVMWCGVVAELTSHYLFETLF